MRISAARAADKVTEAREEAKLQKQEAKLQYGRFSTVFNRIDQLEKDRLVLEERVANLKECLDKHK